VVSTRNGDEAIRIYTEALSQGNRFDVVLFDLTVPGGAGGDKAIAEILKIDPNAVGIVSSGYADSPVLSDPIRYGFKGHIEKPFRKERLKKVLNDVLHI
jgi:two-component system, cell cycle sensor histidine kinase and response regulator CckA